MSKMERSKPMELFVPTPDKSRDLRGAFGRFATGVTIVTVASRDGPVAITANSFSSVSLDPPLVLWSPEKASRRYPYFAQAEHFAIHVLSAEQDELCWAVARDPFALTGIDYSENAEGVPVVENCLARFECAKHAVYDGGDHEIFVGKILRAGAREDGDALGFFKGKMSRFSASE